ncbi:hypothetical protein DE146DRAFT_175995 [Phaeosphaeria sp. MPI-PUGE-AT-0046c]|nr:hypothetical protein DE146DRAFT_175995 [Phaeosphaeria sp. MPI-PUGE-AT-0046c]
MLRRLPESTLFAQSGQHKRLFCLAFDECCCLNLPRNAEVIEGVNWFARKSAMMMMAHSYLLTYSIVWLSGAMCRFALVIMLESSLCTIFCLTTTSILLYSTRQPEYLTGEDYGTILVLIELGWSSVGLFRHVLPTTHIHSFVPDSMALLVIFLAREIVRGSTIPLCRWQLVGRVETFTLEGYPLPPSH